MATRKIISRKLSNSKMGANACTIRTTTPACTWWNRPEEDPSSGKLESTHPSRTSVKYDQVFFGVESIMRVNAASLDIRDATTSTPGTLNDLTTDLIMANNNNIRTTALALSYSVAEYAAPVWVRSPYVQKLNTELNSACRAVTGCLNPTNIKHLYLLTGMAPPDIRRVVCARMEKTKQETNEAHSLYGQHHAEMDEVQELLFA